MIKDSILDSAEYKATEQFRATGSVDVKGNNVLGRKDKEDYQAESTNASEMPKINSSKFIFEVTNSEENCTSCNMNLPTNSVYKTVHSFLPTAPVQANAVLPEGYEFDTSVGKGIRKMEFDQQAGRFVPKPILANAIVITTIFSGEYGKSDEKLELAFYEPLHKGFRKFIVKREQLAKESTITVVNNYGYSLTFEKSSSEAKKLMRFLKEYEQVNYFTISRQVESQKAGFDDELEEFALYSPKVTIHPEGALQKRFLDKGYIPRGNDLAKYIAGVKEIIMDHSIPIFAYALSFASVLLKIIGAPSFSVELCRHSGYGKSVIQKLALGVWGDPAVLMQPWNSTSIGAEGLFDFNDGIIACMEDAHANDNVDILTSIFYMIFNGTGRNRGAKAGGNRLTTNFIGIFLSSTETESSSRINWDGIRRRILEIIAKPFPTKEESVEAGKLTQRLHDKYFGLAGKRWIELLTANRDRWESWKVCYNETVEYLNDNMKAFGFSDLDKDAAMDQNRLLAVVAVTLQLMKHFFGFTFDEDKVVRDVMEIVYNQLRGNSKALVAIRDVVSWAITNHQSLFSFNSKTGKQLGVFEAGKHMAFEQQALVQYLKDKKFNLSVIDQWKDLGVLEFESDGKTNPKVTTSLGSRVRMVKMKWDELEKYCGKGFYEEDNTL